MRCRHPVIVASIVAAAAFTLLAAGCGGGGGAPRISSVATTTPPPTTTNTTTTSGSRSADKPSPSGGGGPQFRIAMNVGTVDGAKFSACMRKHGVTNFPDPNSLGLITLQSGMGIDPGSPAFMSARTACDKLLPNGGQPTPAEIAQRQQQLLAFSACMRAHGLNDFPDPSNGGIHLHATSGSDLDPNNPTFQKAQEACQGHLPFKGGAAAAPPAKTGSG